MLSELRTPAMRPSLGLWRSDSQLAARFSGNGWETLRKWCSIISWLSEFINSITWACGSYIYSYYGL